MKINFVDVLRRELDKPSWKREQVAVGTATDPYQPIEGHYKLTRRSLEALHRRPHAGWDRHQGTDGRPRRGPARELAQRAGCTVCISVPTVDEDAWAALEPGTAHPLQRLRAVRALRDAGVNAGVLMAPVVPGFTTQPARLEATIKAIADHGAAFMGANIMYLKGGTQDHFMGFLRSEFPTGRRLRAAVSGRLRAGRTTSKTVRGLIAVAAGALRRCGRRRRRVAARAASLTRPAAKRPPANRRRSCGTDSGAALRPSRPAASRPVRAAHLDLDLPVHAAGDELRALRSIAG